MQRLLNTLYVMTPHSYIRLEGDAVVIMTPPEKSDSEILEKQEEQLETELHLNKYQRVKQAMIPFLNLEAIVCVGNSVLSSPLLSYCAKHACRVVFLDRNGRFKARLEGGISGNVLLRQAQYRQADKPEVCLTLAKSFIAGKIRNSRQVLLRSARDSASETEPDLLRAQAQKLLASLRALKVAENLGEVLGIEGEAATAYFSMFDYLLKPEQREVFEFKERSRRPPRNRMNALLSFLYTLTTHDCVSALETVGLDPQMGFFHQLRPGRPALALDLMEEFRAIFADRLAITLINRLQIQKDDFDERIGGAVYLNDKGRRTVLTAYRQRKLEAVQHPFYKSPVQIGLLPCEQARLLARFLRGDVEHYVPFLTR